ncbi:hypothetical protein KAX75_05500 [candidate division WOR-3 bacterium]|nr:hypothetical protein [candidate division WOR-3 bacterium]
MKRYRVLRMDFDTRANILQTDIKDSWKKDIKQLHRKNKEGVINGLKFEFGVLNFEQKLKNFIDIGANPLSIIAFHNRFFRQVRNAFVIGSYYPALTSTCALGERILNHLILRLRNDFKSTPEYKKVYRKKSFDNWDLAIDTLESWGILQKKSTIVFRNLRDIRHKSIHFDPKTESNDREIALKAIHKMNEIIDNQFSAFGNLPWFIPNLRGSAYIKKSYEKTPFISIIYLPNCVLVGPNHRIEPRDNKLVVVDDNSYPNKEISDKEFAKMLEDNR